jgi:hypothetical protein
MGLTGGASPPHPRGRLQMVWHCNGNNAYAFEKVRAPVHWVLFDTQYTLKTHTRPWYGEEGSIRRVWEVGSEEIIILITGAGYGPSGVLEWNFITWSISVFLFISPYMPMLTGFLLLLSFFLLSFHCICLISHVHLGPQCQKSLERTIYFSL